MEERPKIGVAVLIEKDGKILMGKRKYSHGKDSWCLPGGHVEFGEKLIDAAKRETKEETGIEVSGLELLSVTDDIMYGKHYVTVSFKASVVEGEPILKKDEKFLDMAWFEIDKLPEPLFTATRNVLDNYLSKKIYDGKDSGIKKG